MFQRGFGLPPSLLSSTPLTLVNVRLYGETEFWFALIKVLAIIGMISALACGCCFLVTAAKASIDNPLALRWFLCHRLEWADFVAGGDYVLPSAVWS